MMLDVTLLVTRLWASMKQPFVTLCVDTAPFGRGATIYFHEAFIVSLLTHPNELIEV